MASSNTWRSENLERIQSTKYARIVVVGDTHIANHRQCGGLLMEGLNQRCRWIIDSLKNYIGHEGGRTLVIQVGDFFDVSKPPPNVILAALNLIKETSVSADWLVLSGNHDSNGPEQASAIRLLEFAGAATIERATLVNVRRACPREYADVRICCLPYTHPSAMQAFADAQEHIADSDVVVAHYGVVATDQQVRPDALRADEVAELDRKLSASIVRRNPPAARHYFFGHEHNSRVHGYAVTATTNHTAWVCSVGAFVDTNFDVNNPHMRNMYDISEGPDVLPVHRSSEANKPWLFVPNSPDSVLNHPALFHDGFCVRVPIGAEPFAELLKAAGALSSYAIAPAQALINDSNDTDDETESQSFLGVRELLIEASQQLERTHNRPFEEALLYAMELTK